MQLTVWTALGQSVFYLSFYYSVCPCLSIYQSICPTTCLSLCQQVGQLVFPYQGRVCNIALKRRHKGNCLLHWIMLVYLMISQLSVQQLVGLSVHWSVYLKSIWPFSWMTQDRLAVYLSYDCWSVCWSGSLSVCLSVYLSVCLSVFCFCLTVG